MRGRTHRRPPLPASGDPEHQDEHDLIKVLVQGFDAETNHDGNDRAADRARKHVAAKHAVLCHLVDHHEAEGKTYASDGLEDMLDDHERMHRHVVGS